MNKSDFYYDLPKELIAETPVYPRDSSRLLVYHKKNGEIEHKRFNQITDYLKKGDVLVINDTKVIPARLFCNRAGKDERIEILLIKRLEINRWECIAKPAKKLKIGTKLIFSDELTAEVEKIGEDGIRVISLCHDGVLEEILDKIGTMPLPPYIKKKLDDKSRYNTVYCNEEGSSAAPTAGLHFTEELLEKIESFGVTVVKVLLHVGLGTFRPVKEENILDHKMHSEYCRIDEESAKILNKAKSDGQRIIAVGTTSVRTLESMTDVDGRIMSGAKETSIFIYPGYRFKSVDALITNFHLPESTLIMLVSAFMGRENTLRAYREAVCERYKFFSFGDAMFIE